MLMRKQNVMVNNQSRTGQAFWLGLGSVVSFLFGLVSTAVLSRILPVSEYGTYRQVLYVYATLQIVFSLGLPRAYSFFLPRLPIEEGRRSIDKINLIFIGAGLLFGVILYIFSDMIAGVLNNGALGPCLRRFSPTPVFLLPVLGLESVMATYRRTYFTVVYVIINRVLNLVCVLSPVIMWHCGAQGAVTGLTVSAAICCCVGLWLERLPFRGIQSRSTSLTAGGIMRYSLPLMWAGIWGIVIKSAPQFFISRRFGTEAFAGFANGFIELPFASMLIGAVAGVLLPEISRLARDEANMGRVLELWRTAFEKSAAVIYPLAVFASVFAEDVILLLYGDKYAGAAIYFRMIVVVNLVRVVPYAPVMLGLGLGKKYALASLVPAVVAVAGEWAATLIVDSPVWIAGIQCGALILHVGMMFYYIGRRTGVGVARLLPWRRCGVLLGLSAGAVMATYTAMIMCGLSAGFLRLAAGFVLAGSLYLCVSRICGISYTSLLRPLLRRRNAG